MKRQNSVHQGDVVVVSGAHVGDRRRTGVVEAVLGGTGHEHYRIAWEDGHESILFPGADTRIEPAIHSGSTRS